MGIQSAGRGERWPRTDVSESSMSKEPNDKRHLRAVIHSCAGQLAELAEFIDECPDYIFLSPCRVMGGTSTIGKHVRHALDHYQTILLAVQQPGRPVKYDEKAIAKARLVAKEVEKDRSACVQAVDTIRMQLEAIPMGDSDDSISNEVQVVMMTSAHPVWMQSTICRELHFAFHHAVHHDHAMRTIASQLGQTTKENFGVAPATLYFRKLKTKLKGKLNPNVNTRTPNSKALALGKKLKAFRKGKLKWTYSVLSDVNSKL